MATRFCSHCGSQVDDSTKFCTNCGAPIPPLSSEPKPQPELQPVVNSQPTGPKPTSYLALAILVTIFCCLPFGIVSIVKAAKVDSLWNSGKYLESQDASRKARNWAIAAIISAIVAAIIYVVLVLFLGAAALGGLDELLEELS